MAKKKHIDDTDYQLNAERESEQLLDLIMPGEEVAPVASATPQADATTPVAAPKDTNDKDIDDDNDEALDKKTAQQRLFESLTDDEGEKSEGGLSFVLGGNILTTKWLRKQILWLVMVVALAMLYVSNRYYAQKQEVHIQHLKRELKENHYNAMARSAQLMRLYRRSTIIEHLENIPGNDLIMPPKQPAVIPNP